MVSYISIISVTILTIVSGDPYHYHRRPVYVGAYHVNAAPFTAFNPNQIQQVHGSGQFSSRRFSQPSNSQSSYSSPSNTRSYSSFNRSPLAAQFTRLRTDFDLVAKKAGTDPVGRVNDLADGLIKILREFAANKDAVKFVKDNSEESSCIGSLDDAISATKSASEIISSSAPELTTFLDTYESLKDEKDVLVLIKGTATMLELMDVIIPKLSKFSLSTQCRVSPEDSLRGLEELGNILTNMANTRTIAFQPSARDYLKRSANIVKATGSFFSQLRTTLGSLSKFCSSDPEFSKSAVAAIGDMFDEVVEYLVALGSDIDIAEIREKNIAFTERLVASVEAIRKQDLGFLPCNTGLSYKGTAENLLDLADIIKEIGVDVLSEELGINFDLGF